MINYLNRFRHKLIRKIRVFFLLQKVESHHNELYVGGKTVLTNKTNLGKNPSFNGMIINGIGKVRVVDYFIRKIDAFFAFNMCSNRNCVSE